MPFHMLYVRLVSPRHKPWVIRGSERPRWWSFVADLWTSIRALSWARSSASCCFRCFEAMALQDLHSACRAACTRVLRRSYEIAPHSWHWIIWNRRSPLRPSLRCVLPITCFINLIGYWFTYLTRKQATNTKTSTTRDWLYKRQSRGHYWNRTSTKWPHTRSY